jgi:predicted TIM-barrel fold metal-dependent hydrolase
MNRRHALAGALLPFLLPGAARAAAPDGGRMTAAIDTHAHVFERGLKLAQARRYAPGYDATLADYLATLDRHGIARGVLVQPSFLGTDNGYLVAALRQAPARLRGIAVVEPGVGFDELQRLDAAGVVGIRLNLVGGAPIPEFASAPWRTLLGHVARLRWQVEVHREAADLPRILPALLDAGVVVVVDHFGRPDPALGVDDPGFRFLLDAGARRRVWVKLSAAYRNGADGRGERIAHEAIPLLRAALGADRLLWGSDWPHTQFESAARYGQARAALDAWLPDADERRAVLVDTPQALFRFG